MTTLAKRFGISVATVHSYIEEYRQKLRDSCIDLAAQERDRSLELLDAAIEVLGVT